MSAPYPRCLLAIYRRTGADLPFGDARRPHGVAMEGSYWRLTDAASARVVVALRGACLGPGGPWAIVALATHPEGLVRSLTASGTAPELISDSEDELRVDLGPGARLHVRFADRRPWPRTRPFGGLGPAQSVPALPQYWHPHLLGARASGTLELPGTTVPLEGASAYAEKNWGSRFSHHWWWGQAHDFPNADACVAFAGGRIALAGIRAAPTAVVARVQDTLVRLGPPLARTTVAVGRTGWRVRARGPLHAIEIEGEAAACAPATLPVPIPDQHTTQDRSHQWLAGNLTVHVRRGRRTLLRGTSPLAGLERAIDLGH